MSELKDMVDDVYIESFARDIVEVYIKQREYEPLSDEEMDMIVSFSNKLIKTFNVQSQDAIETKTIEDKMKLDEFLTRLLDTIINLLSYVILFKTEEVVLNRDIRILKEKLDNG